MDSFKKYKKLHEKIEEIVRNDGDEHLNIFNFITKIKLELSANDTERVAEINAIPLELIEEIKNMSMEEIEEYQKKMKLML